MKKLYISRINLVGSLRIRFFKLLSSIVNNIESIKTKEQKKQNQHNSLLKVFANNDNSISVWVKFHRYKSIDILLRVLSLSWKG